MQGLLEHLGGVPADHVRADEEVPKVQEGEGRARDRRGAGLLFKGSGFYITDYRSDSYKKAAKAENGKSEGGKSESKSEKKSESKSSDTKSSAKSSD